MNTTIEDYKEYIHYLSQNNENRIFLNSDDEKATAVFVELFNKAKDHIRMFSGSLSNGVTSNNAYISAISDFIEKGGNLDILLNSYTKEKALNSDFLKRIAFFSLKGKNVTIKKSNDHPYLANGSDKKEVHFTIVDDNAYRLETDIDLRMSICNMNDSAMAKNLSTFFDGLFVKAEIIDLAKDLNM